MCCGSHWELFPTHNPLWPFSLRWSASKAWKALGDVLAWPFMMCLEMNRYECFFLFWSCMKTLSQPLLDVQLRDPDTLPLSPLRTFATEILVRENHSSLFANTLRASRVVLTLTLRVFLCFAGDSRCCRRVPPSSRVPPSAEEETGPGLPGGGGAVP